MNMPLCPHLMPTYIAINIISRIFSMMYELREFENWTIITAMAAKLIKGKNLCFIVEIYKVVVSFYKVFFAGKFKKKIHPLGNFLGRNKSMQSRRKGKWHDLLFHKF